MNSCLVADCVSRKAQTQTKIYMVFVSYKVQSLTKHKLPLTISLSWDACRISPPVT